MDDVTSSLGDKLREFKDLTCAAFETRELEREFNARARRRAKKDAEKQKITKPPHQVATSNTGERDHLRPQASAGLAAIDSSEETVPAAEADNKSRRLKDFSLNTYKVHALGDYTATIRRYGTTDSYSTEPVSSECFTWLILNCFIGRTRASLTQGKLLPDKSQKFYSADDTDRAAADSCPSYP